MTHWTERHTVLLAVYVILRRADGHILLLRRANTDYMNGKLSLPSGHAEGDEPAERAAAREAKEEVGIEIRPADLRLTHTLHRKAESNDHERIDLFFETSKWQGEPYNAEPHKCSELIWADPVRLPSDMVPLVVQTLANIAAGKPYASHYFNNQERETSK